MAPLPHRTPKLPTFDESSSWKWDGHADYEGDRIHADGLWLCRRRDPMSQSPGTMLTLAEDFEKNAPKRFELAVNAFIDFAEAFMVFRRDRQLVAPSIAR